MDLGESHSSSSSALFNESFYETDDEQTLEKREGAQPCLFEPYDREASSGTDSSNESEELRAIRAIAKHRLVRKRSIVPRLTSSVHFRTTTRLYSCFKNM